MEILTLVALIAVCVYSLNAREQRRRIVLLGSHLGRYQIEKLMESLTDGYLRWLGESDAQRRDQMWSLLGVTEEALSAQFEKFSAEFSRVDGLQARVSKLPVAVPYARNMFPQATFDLRRALSIHARGIADAAVNSRQLTPKAKAYTMSAELFLMQHTCHWFCKSKATASARMLARHKTSYDQLVAGVAPNTRSAYGTLVGR
jgi:hypothetical protein